MTADRPTGPQLIHELRVAACARGLPLSQFAQPLAISTVNNFVQSLNRSSRPLPETIARVRALIEGRPLPPPRPSPNKGHARGSRVHEANDGELKRCSQDELERRRRITDQAHAARRPGETLHAAVRRITGAGA